MYVPIDNRMPREAVGESRAEFWERHRRNSSDIGAAPMLGKLFRNR